MYILIFLLLFSKVSAELPVPFFYFENLDFATEPSHKLDGTTLIIKESHPCFHSAFFHLLEHIAGVWAFYGHEHSSEIKRIVFADLNDNSWEGPNQINKHLLQALFPEAEILPFRSLCGNGSAFISDRSLANNDIACQKINKHLGAALPHIDPKKLQSLADKVHAYAHTTLQLSEKIRVTYITRPPPRCLTPEIELEMLKQIALQPNVSLKAIDFAKISFQEQINIIGNTDLLIGVHGNGLSHILFLPPHASVIEIFPPGNHHLDYRLFADIHGIDYYGILYNEQEFLERNRAYNMGAYGLPASAIDKLPIPLIIQLLQLHFAPVQVPFNTLPDVLR